MKYTIELSEMGVKLLHGVFLQGMEAGHCKIAADLTPEECIEDMNIILDDVVTGFLAKNPDRVPETLQ